MIEVSSILFSLLTEGFIVLLLVIIVAVFLLFRKKNIDRAAAQKLVKQIKQQSKTRLGETGSFLSEKYRFEGNELEKAVKTIDKAEKKFMQHVINMYLQRDSHKLEVMDASVAELIEAYKELSPVMPEENSSASAEQEEQLNDLREANEKLTEELTITKQTMGNMINEFGNMFGGGQENQLPEEEVIKKVQVTDDKQSETAQDQENEAIDEIQLDDAEIEQMALEATADELEPDELLNELSIDDIDLPETETKTEISKKDTPSMDVFDEGIDDLMDGIDLADDDT